MYESLFRDSYFRVVDPKIIADKVEVLGMDGILISH